MTMETPRNDGWICLDNRKNRQKYRILCVIPTVAAMEYVLIYSYSLSDILSAYYLTLRLTFLQGILSGLLSDILTFCIYDILSMRRSGTLSQ